MEVKLTDELWRDIIGYEGIYKISSYGRVKSEKQDEKNYVLETLKLSFLPNKVKR